MHFGRNGARSRPLLIVYIIYVYIHTHTNTLTYATRTLGEMGLDPELSSLCNARVRFRPITCVSGGGAYKCMDWEKERATERAYLQICVCVCMHLHACAHAYIHTCVRACECVSAHVCARAYVCMCMSACVFVLFVQIHVYLQARHLQDINLCACRTPTTHSPLKCQQYTHTTHNTQHTTDRTSAPPTPVYHPPTPLYHPQPPGMTAIHNTKQAIDMKVSTENATPPESTKSRISDSSVSRGTNSN